MSEDYVNQLTLNFLISKSQLDKLNKKRNSERQQTMKTEREIFREEIYKLFDDLFHENVPSDLLNDVKDAYEHFISKSIYYFKARKKDNELEEEVGIKEDINFDDDGNNDFEEEEQYYKEDDEEEQKNDAEEDDEEEEIKSIEITDFESNVKPVHKKYPNKYKLTEGSEDIHKLPLDWFKTTRKNYTMNQILPRKKEIN
jgi:hypothetical protein